MKRRSPGALLALLLLGGGPLAAQLVPPATGGVARLDRLLQQLGEDRRVLLIGAHPDDEDTRLLAAFAQGRGVRTAYLSLTRGEGGQNLVGEELGVPLGLLRSRELERARGIDGAEQFFTRAFDFGYTRSRPETERFWNADEILRDAVRIVRTFRPHVIVSVFSGSERDGHGHHQTSGVLAQEAYRAAGDPAAFPDLPAEPWQPFKLYRATRFSRGESTLEVPIGGLDPRTGLTYNQIAMASRSSHRSQDFGALQPTGPGATSLGLVESRVGGEDADVFSGIPGDTSWLPRLADSLRAGVTAVGMEEAAGPLARALVRARGERRAEDRLALLAEATAVAAGLVLDARSDAEELIPGTRHAVEVQLYNAGRDTVMFRRVALLQPDGRTASAEAGRTVVPPGGDATVPVTVTLAQDLAPSQPYFLTHPMEGARYDWTGVAGAIRGRPFDPPVMEIVAEVVIAGVDVPLRREVTYRYADQAVGEIRRPVRVVPEVDVRLSPERLVWSSTDGASRTFTVALRHHGTAAVAGEVSLEVDGWPAPPAQPFALETEGQTATMTFEVRRPADVVRGTVAVTAIARADDGRRFDAATRLVEYSHVRPTQYVVPATSEVRVAPVTLPAVGRVGYVRGAADRVPQALAALGVPVELLDAIALAEGDLTGFDAIIVGSRAYETDTALVQHNDRLLAYARNGGLLLVQYQQYQFVRGGFAPYPLDISRPHDRITDETAPVRILEPDHPVFRQPHAIGPEDWEGWPQERGLYFAGRWDAAYTPLLEMQDPGLGPVRGGLLVAPYGSGTYVYTGISFFRSLPAGVPGAARLFLNLLALGAR